MSKLRKLLKSEQGISLIEVVATVVISVISMMRSIITTISIQSLYEQKRQISSNNKLTEVPYILKFITK